MALTLISGTVGSGKSTAIIKRLIPFARRQAGLCIVPNESNAFELRQNLLAQNEALLGEMP